MLNFLKRRLPAALTTQPNPAKNPACSEPEVDLWQISDFICRRLVPIIGVRPFPLNEQIMLAAAVCRIRPSHIFEWGTHVGKSARAFYEIAREFAVPVEIHSTDLPDDARHVEHPGNTRGRLVRGLDDVHLHQGDGLETSLTVCRELRRNGVAVRPLFFVDGDHAYESVLRELDAILREEPQAAVLLHDTFFQAPESGYNVGPHRAIRDVLDRQGEHYAAIHTQFGLPGMTLVYRKQLSLTNAQRHDSQGRPLQGNAA